jgi:RNA polymerase sigma-70 factor (ECF subfamily)
MQNGSESPLVTDADIVERVIRGDVQSYGALVERYERAALAAVLPVIRDVHAAQDVIQDVFVQCYLKLSSLRVGARFGFWLLKTARREAIRAGRRRQRDYAALSQMPMRSADHDERLLDDEIQRLLYSVQQLPAHERWMVSLHYFEGQSVQEIAQTTGRPVGTVTKRLSRAIQRLRGELRNEEQSCQMKSPMKKSAVH